MSGSQYHFKRFCRSVSRPLLQQFIAKVAPTLKVDWGTVLVKNVDTLYHAFLELDPETHNRLDLLSNEIYDVFENPAASVTINDFVHSRKLNIPPDFEQWTDNDQTLWLFLNDGEAWNELLQWGAADAKSRIPWFHQHIDSIGDGPGEYSEEQIHSLEKEISRYYYWTEGRGCFCKCHPVLRRQSSREECFLISLSDHPHTEEQWNSAGELSTDVHCGAFEIVFLYNWEDKTLKVKAAGVRDHKLRLCRIWAHFMRHASITDLETEKMAFLLNQFRNGDVKLALDKLWDIKFAEVTAIGLGIKGNRASRATFESEDGNLPQKIDYASRFGDKPLSTMDVYYVRIKITLNESYGRSRHQTLEIYCDRSNVPSLNIKVQKTLNDALKEWKIAA